MVAERTIAIFGATSHIAKSLMHGWRDEPVGRLHLFTRRPAEVHSFLQTVGGHGVEGWVVHEGYADLRACRCDVLINCVGVGTARKLGGDYSRYFSVTEEFDNLAIAHLRDTVPHALYISLSSGAVYGREHDAPVDEDSVNQVRVNQLVPADYYGIARLNAEAKHRSLGDLNIVDLRIFSYFSRHIDLRDGYFITDILDCIRRQEVLVTDRADMVRDYLHPEDLLAMVAACLRVGHLNATFDVVSAKPVRKSEILEHFARRYGLRFEIRASLDGSSATGAKKVYCSSSRAAARIGYAPRFSSLETISQEARHVLAGCGLTLEPE